MGLTIAVAAVRDTVAAELADSSESVVAASAAVVAAFVAAAPAAAVTDVVEPAGLAKAAAVVALVVASASAAALHYSGLATKLHCFHSEPRENSAAMNCSDFVDKYLPRSAN